MNDIGPEARSLFEAARNAERLPGPKRAHIKQAVLLQVATLGAATAVSGGAAAMSPATKLTLVAVAVAMLGGGSLSMWAWKQHNESASLAPSVSSLPSATLVAAEPAVVNERPTVEEPAPVIEPVPAAEPVANQRPMAEEPVPASTGPHHRVSAGAGARQTLASARAPKVPQFRVPEYAQAQPEAAIPSPATEDAPAPALTNQPGLAPVSLDSELKLLRQAQEDLRLGSPTKALNRLADFDRLFPKAKLDQERRAIEAIANCQARPGPAALALAQRFLQQAPLSPLAARVRSACQQNIEPTDPRREP